MEKIKKGPYDAQTRRKDIRVSVAMIIIAVFFLALITFPFFSLTMSLFIFVVAVAMLVLPFTFLTIRVIQKTPDQTRTYPMFEHRTNSTSILYLLVGATEKHDLQIVKHRWSGKVEISVDDIKRWTHEPKKSKDALKIEFNIGTNEIHAVEIAHNPTSVGGIAIVIDGTLDYIFD